MGEGIVDIQGAAFHAGEYRQDIGFQILIHGAEQSDSSLVLGHGIVHAFQRVHHFKEGVSGGVSTGSKAGHHFLRVHAQGGKCFYGAVAAVLSADIEFLDRVAHLINGKHAGFRAVYQAGEEFICGKPQRGILRGVFIQRIQQIPVLVGAVLCAHRDDVIGFLGADAEVFHQGAGSTSGLLQVITEGVPQGKAGFRCLFQFIAHQAGSLFYGGETVSYILQAVTEIAGVDILRDLAQRLQFRAGRAGRSGDLVDRLIVRVTQTDQFRAPCNHGSADRRDGSAKSGTQPFRYAAQLIQFSAAGFRRVPGFGNRIRQSFRSAVRL